MSKNTNFNQYFTPRKVADYMASLFSDLNIKSEINILDPGVGKGILAISLIKYILDNYSEIKKIKCVCYEIDPLIIIDLKKNINDIKFHFLENNVSINFEIRNKDFIREYTDNEKYDVIISNPPYEKIKSNSDLARYLNTKGISHINLYSTFIEISLTLLQENGTLVSIIPRSFTNGSYFTEFRKKVLESSSLTLLHLFKSRNLFQGVLQEFLIVKFEKQINSRMSLITTRVSESHDPFKYNEIIIDKDIVIDKENNNVIKIFNNYREMQVTNFIEKNGVNINLLGLSVSTGPLVDFRDIDNKFYNYKDSDVIPCIFTEHMSQEQLEIIWPLKTNKKGNYVTRNISPKKLKVSGNYVIMKRFSPNKNNKRFYSNIVPSIEDNEYITFDNKINYFHANNKGIDGITALGISLYLNTSMVEIYLNQIVGNTQLNCSDLKSLKYPELKLLRAIGFNWQNANMTYNLSNIDKVVLNVLKIWE